MEIAGTKLYTLKEIAPKLGVSVATLRAYIEQGRLSAFRLGRSYRVTEQSLKDFLHGCPTAPPSSLGPPEDDPILQVIGIGVDGKLTRGLDANV